MIKYLLIKRQLQGDHHDFECLSVCGDVLVKESRRV